MGACGHNCPLRHPSERERDCPQLTKRPQRGQDLPPSRSSKPQPSCTNSLVAQQRFRVATSMTMPPPTTAPTTTTPEMAAADLLATGTLTRTDITITTTITLPDERPPTGPQTSSTTSSSTAETPATATPEAPQNIDNREFGIPPLVGTNGTDDSGPVPPALSVVALAPRDDGAVVCVRPFGVVTKPSLNPSQLTSYEEPIIFAWIIGVVLLFCFAGPCWDAVVRLRARRQEGEELLQGPWEGEVACTRGGSLG